MLCSNCGKELEDSNISCPSCGTKYGDVPETPPSTRSEKPLSQVALLPREVAKGFLIIITGAVMMLTAMALVWYTVYGHEYYLLDFDDLNNSSSVDYWVNWYGAALPLILVIVFASVAILSAVYSLATGQRFKQLWGWLSFLSAAALIANFLYLLVVYSGKEYSEDVRPHIGWVVALIGAIAIGIGTIIIDIGSKKKPHSQIALLPMAVAQIASLPRKVATGFLIIITGAIMMLISLALAWYSVHTDMAQHFLLKFDFLNNWRWLADSGTHWSGTTLPLVLMIVFASITILSTVYALATGQRFRRLWGWLSLLSAAVIIANFLYFRVYYWDHGYVRDFTPHIGWVVALIGAIAIGIGAIIIGIDSKKKPLS
ncbi:MAG: zinc ribbon domain-containing protein [Dehalococcoidia bacterium]